MNLHSSRIVFVLEREDEKSDSIILNFSPSASPEMIALISPMELSVWPLMWNRERFTFNPWPRTGKYATNFTRNEGRAGQMRIKLLTGASFAYRIEMLSLGIQIAD